MPRCGPMLTEAQGKKIEPLLPRLRKHRRGGRPWADNRRVLEGILWILRSGARWQDLPERYPPPSTCLAAVARLGGAGRLAEHLESVPERAERTPTIEVE